MSEYVDVAIIENGKVIGSFKALHKTEEKAEIDQKADEYAYNEWRDFPEEQAIARRGFKAGVEFLQKENEELKQQIEKMKRHCNCKHRDSEGYCEVKRTYLIDLSYDGCDKWELED